ncbi:dermonecrotic toxin domain-containing protein [Pseudomonas sp. NR3]|uniref:dermonecrotic toxin domain-containing protein n=1 Tax=Pseudomonas sp. NR3 TaxID=3155978 RepID=UPI003B66CFEB
MTSLSPTDSVTALEENSSQPFADRPTFEQVVQHMLEQALKEKYPELTIDLSKTRLAVPDAAAKGWNFQPFMPLVLDYLALGTPIDFSPQGALDCYLSDSPPSRLWSGNRRLDITVVEKCLLELPWIVPIGLEDALTRYWNGDISTTALSETTLRISRWRGLSDTLRNGLHIRRLQQPGLSVPARQALDQIARWPERAQRFQANASPVYAYGLKSTVTRGSTTIELPGTDILLVHYTEYGLTLLLCSPGGTVQPFESMDAVNRYRGEQIAKRYVVDTVTCQRYELAGDAFEAQAAMILGQQLVDLRAMQLPARIGLADLKALYSELSDPSRYLRDLPGLTPQASARLDALRPDWLKKASPTDEAHFRRATLALASATKNASAQTDITDINAYTVDALLTEMEKINDSSPNKVSTSQFHPDDIELIFTVSAGFPGTVGISEKRTMSLTQLAIANLVGRPSGHLKISHRKGFVLPAWLTQELITEKNGLIERVDIGATYPQYLRKELLGDSPQARKHQQVFAEQLSAQLPLQALQQMLNHEHGLSRQGLQLIEALLQPDAEDRQVEGRPVVIRHLAFLRKPQAQPDIVGNMFIVEAKDAKTGPHLLYRPLCKPSLVEFATQQALLQAIATAGDVQKSVLTWMSDAARPVYANGGFKEPHIVRFLQGDEFTAPEKPAPATLAIDGVNEELLQYLKNGKLLQYLYGCNAQALVTQADRNSVSNSESRWAMLLEGGGLLFNTLLFPLLRGPAMAIAWLWNLMASASHDLPALASEDPATRESAFVDFLVNLALLTSHVFSGPAPSRAPIAESLKEQAMRPPAPRVIAEQWPAPAKPDILEGAVTLPDAHADTLSQILDLSFTSAHHRLTPEQRTQLRNMTVPRPMTLPEPFSVGAFNGLYVIDSKWHALVDETLFRVIPEIQGDKLVVRVVDPLDPLIPGPQLQSDGQGNWSMDLDLRLRGGMPPKRIAEQRRLKDQRRTQLNDDLAGFLFRQPEQYAALRVAEQVLKKVEEGSTYTEAQRAPKRQTFYTLIEQQIDIRRKLLDSMPERDELNISLPADRVRELLGDVASYAGIASEATHTEHQALQVENSRFLPPAPEVLRNHTESYLDYLKKTLDINSRRIRWLELNEEHLEKLFNQGSAGVKVYEKLTKNRPLDAINSMTAKSLQMSTLNLLSLKNPGSSLSVYMYRVFEPLGKQVRTHSDLHLYELTPSEELLVLESLSEQYARTLDHLQGMRTLYPDDINQPYFNQLTELMESLYQDASSKLATEVKPEPEPERVKQPPKRPNAAEGRPRKKVIKTRNNGVLIGDFKPAGTSLPIDVVELRSDINDEVVATYSLHDDVWDPVDVRKPEPAAAPVPAPAPKTRRVETISRDARKLLGQLNQRLRRAEDYKTRCRYPQEIEEILNNEASRFRALSDELDKAIASSQTPRTPEDGALRTQLTDAITRLTNRGSTLRTELSLSLPPTDGNLRYLFEKDLIQVARLGGREALAGARKDFLQEYAVNDRDGFPLWYAHFHYEAVDTPKAHYSVAHLKTNAQRREHYYSLLAKASNPYAVIDVHRGQIGRSLAQSRFLPLAP